MSQEEPTNTTSANLLEFARLIELDEISSEVLPTYVQALLSVRLIEPDALCRRAAKRLAHHYPPLTARAVAERLRDAAHEIQAPSASADPRQPFATPSPAHFSLKGFLERLRRFWPTQSP